jgi:hypothetical protein
MIGSWPAHNDRHNSLGVMSANNIPRAWRSACEQSSVDVMLWNSFGSMFYMPWLFQRFGWLHACCMLAGAVVVSYMSNVWTLRARSACQLRHFSRGQAVSVSILACFQANGAAMQRLCTLCSFAVEALSACLLLGVAFRANAFGQVVPTAVVAGLSACMPRVNVAVVVVWGMVVWLSWRIVEDMVWSVSPCLGSFAHQHSLFSWKEWVEGIALSMHAFGQVPCELDGIWNPPSNDDVAMVPQDAWTSYSRRVHGKACMGSFALCVCIGVMGSAVAWQSHCQQEQQHVCTAIPSLSTIPSWSTIPLACCAWASIRCTNDRMVAAVTVLPWKSLLLQASVWALVIFMAAVAPVQQVLVVVVACECTIVAVFMVSVARHC